MLLRFQNMAEYHEWARQWNETTATTLITCALIFKFCFVLNTDFLMNKRGQWSTLYNNPRITLVTIRGNSWGPMAPAPGGTPPRTPRGPQVKECRPHYLNPVPASQPKHWNEVGLRILQLHLCILYKHSPPSPSSSPRTAQHSANTPTLWLWPPFLGLPWPRASHLIPGDSVLQSVK